MHNKVVQGQKKPIMIYFILALFLVFIDFITKQWALNTLEYGDLGIDVLPPVLKWTLAYNKGAAFSFLASQAGWQRWFLVGISTVAIILFSIWLIYRKPYERVLPWGLAFVLAGATGNWIDRIYSGYVVDFIHVYYEQYSFPIFNFADICVSIGAGIIILSSFMDKPPK